MARHDSLFHRPRPACVVLQHFFVVVCLDHQRAHIPHAFLNEFSSMAKISENTEGCPVVAQYKPHGIHRVVRHWKSLDIDILDRNEAPVANSRNSLTLHSLTA